uniref:Uncharacterized protein n=1 Tax=Trichobilharzia regenti TaxID=157069 RepID=A0AA85IYG3_TRIRE|nr:unnamed protein product [Trichobilharzia regenti]
MILSRASSTHTAHNSQTKQSGSPRFFVWFIVDLIIMILMTVGAVILIHNIPTIGIFFTQHYYVEYILLSVTGVLIIVFIFVRKIRSNYLATRMVLETVVLLWSVIFAIVFKSTEWTHELISLGDLKGKISCFAMVVLIGLFIIIIMFTCVSVQTCCLTDPGSNCQNTLNDDFAELQQI